MIMAYGARDGDILKMVGELPIGAIVVLSCSGL